MYDFIVLGLVPGTNIQIGFTAWMGLAVLVLLGILAAKRHFNRTHLMGLAVKRRFGQVYRTVEVMAPFHPPHASQLHQRLRPAAR